MNDSYQNQQLDAGPLNIHWAWMLVLGILLFILGIWAIAYSTMISVIAMYWFGALLLASGIIQIFSVFIAKKRKHFAYHLLVSVLSIIAGCWMVLQPVSATVTLVWVIALYLFVSGMIHLIFAFSDRREAWYWMLLNGLIEILLAFMMWANWPITGMWVIGLFISIHVLLSGWYLMSLSFLVKRANV